MTQLVKSSKVAPLRPVQSRTCTKLRVLVILVLVRSGHGDPGA